MGKEVRKRVEEKKLWHFIGKSLYVGGIIPKLRQKRFHDYVRARNSYRRQEMECTELVKTRDGHYKIASELEIKEAKKKVEEQNLLDLITAALVDNAIPDYPELTTTFTAYQTEKMCK